MLNAKDTIFKSRIPTYNDGCFYLFRIEQSDDKKYAEEYLKKLGGPIYFEELSISDKLKFEAEERQIKLVGKIRISQDKNIDSLCVLKIGEEYYSVYNIYHFTNNDGYKQSDITLTTYKG